MKIRLILRYTNLCPAGEVTGHMFETVDVEVENWPSNEGWTYRVGPEVVGAEIIGENQQGEKI